MRRFFAFALKFLLMPFAYGEDSACPVSQGGTIKNEVLETATWPEGKVVFKPGGPGFAFDDGAVGMKWIWNRLMRGALKIHGRRLDGEAPPLRASIPDGYGDSGIQATALIFPTPGCWEVTGSVGEGSLTFVTLVEKIGDGPCWRETPPEPDDPLCQKNGQTVRP